MGVDDISEQGRNTSGVKLMDIAPNSDVMVAGIAKVRETQQKDKPEELVTEQPEETTTEE